MKFKTHNDNIPFISGWLQGQIIADYKELKKLFGKPTKGDEYKVDAEWEILFEDGSYATIYNWKDGKNYNGKSGTPITKITDWHIGGENKNAIPHIESLLLGLR
jgi:hypothetical protein